MFRACAQAHPHGPVRDPDTDPETGPETRGPSGVTQFGLNNENPQSILGLDTGPVAWTGLVCVVDTVLEIN